MIEELSDDDLQAMLPMLEARGMTTFGAVKAETGKHGRLLEDLT